MSQVDVVLIRGLAREKGHWGEFLKILKEQHFVRTVEPIDLLGAGEFHKLTSPLTISENAEFVLSQLDMGRLKNVIIVSVSLGSMVSIEMCRKKPELFEKAFVMNTSFSNLSPIYHRLQFNAMKRFVKILRSKDIIDREKQILKMVSGVKEKQESLSNEWADIAEKHPMHIKNFARQLLAASIYNLPEHPPSVPIIVLSSLGDQMVNPSCSRQLAKKWDLPQFVHPSAGHDICVDDPKWVVDKIAENL